MMKHKSMKHKAMTYTAIIAWLLVLLLGGCQLAQEGEAGLRLADDRLIGVLLTYEYLDLFDMEGYLNADSDRLQAGEIIMDEGAAAFQGRLYGEIQEIPSQDENGSPVLTVKYEFPGVEGLAFFTAILPESEDDGIVSQVVYDPELDADWQDGGKELEATIYLDAYADGATYYYNPVYQNADGSVYVTSSSSSVSFGPDLGESRAEGVFASHTLAETTTVTRNGLTSEESFSVTVSLCLLYPAQRVTLLQMDADSVLLSRAEYDPGQMPEAVSLDENCAYVIVESAKTDSDGQPLVSRELYGAGAAAFATYILRENGVFLRHWTELDWQ